MITLNKKEYTDNGIFENKFIQEYCNLNIYPLIGTLEKEAGLMSDLAEVMDLSYQIYGPDSEDIHVLKDNLLNFKQNGNNVIVYVHSSIKKFDLVSVGDIVLSMENSYFDNCFFKKVKIENTSKVLYLNKHCAEIFDKKFWYYFDNGKFVYDNLICYTMIIKNGGNLLEKVLTDNLPFIDRWCILDTGSTDGTQETIKRVLKNKKGVLYEEPFVDFKVSRNRCLELAGHTCKFIMILDDTYSLKGDIRNFLTEVRGDQFSDSFSMLIQSDDTEYYSNRIIKSNTNLRYIHTIHEVITNENNINVTVPPEKALIFDNRAEYMEKRTNDRKQFDLQLLFKETKDDPDDPRALYYIAQTYGCIGDEINKAKYFELRINHPVQGYVQEKIDACFELARCYNFKVDPVTKELYQIEQPKLNDKQWERCEELYLQAFSMDNRRPDSLYFIGIHYYLEKNNLLAYNYFKKAFEVGYPIGSQYSLKPTLSFHFLPKFLAEMCYVFKDYNTGFECSKLFLTASKFNNPQGESWNLMLNWYKIHENLLKMPKISQNPKTMDKRIFCIVTDGGWDNWTGEDIEKKGLGGSETWIVETARWISKIAGFHVVVFCKTDTPRFYNSVGYNPIEMFHNFIAETIVDYCIISRYSEYVPVAIEGHAKNIGIIFHDNLMQETIIPVHQKIKYIWGLTDWHSNNIKQMFPQFEKIVFTQNYGINTDIFNESNIKTSNSFIYSSFPNRGLVVLLKLWPRITKIFPDAVLNIFCNLEQEWVNQVAPQMMKEIKTLLKVLKKGIKVHGWVSKETLAEYWKESEYFLYPCIFEETFCLTALEAAITKTFVISNGLAALGETVGNRGLVIPGNPLTQEWQNECIEQLKSINSLRKEEFVESNYNWAKKLTWENQTKKYIQLL